MYLFQILPILIIFLIGDNLEICWFLRNFFSPKMMEKFENFELSLSKVGKTWKAKLPQIIFFDMQIMSLEWKHMT